MVLEGIFLDWLVEAEQEPPEAAAEQEPEEHEPDGRAMAV